MSQNNKTEQAFQLHLEVIQGARKGQRFLVGNPEIAMTHREAITFRDAHTARPSCIFHIVEI